MTTSHDASATVDASETTRRIQPLPAHVVDKIAAGEVVQRPVSVVKELMENCLDAGSTSIRVHYEPTKIVVHDNGSGIPKQDLGLAATRFATSKLSSVQDFDSLQTFGFRGEALSSMSLVSRLEITSRIASSPIGFVQTYQDGKPTLAQPKPQARPCGTTVTVGDLFYNLPHRRNAIVKKKSEEYAQILACVERYAIHYPRVAFVCEKNLKNNKLVVDFNSGTLVAARVNKPKVADENENDNNDKTTIRILQQVFGSHVRFQKVQSTSEHLPQLRGFCAEPMSDPSQQRRVTQNYFCLFCNHRLVESPSLKKQLDQLYAEFAKQKPACIYLSMEIDPTHVDVNVHPSKKLVTLLHQDEVYREIVQAVKMALERAGHCFEKQSLTPKEEPRSNNANVASSTDQAKKRPLEDSNRNDVTVTPTEEEKPKSAAKKNPVVNPYKKKKVPSNQKIRTLTSAPQGALEPFLSQPLSSQQSDETTSVDHEDNCPLSKGPLDLSQPGAFAVVCTCVSKVRVPRRVGTHPTVKVATTECSYQSIKSLRKRIQKHLDTKRQQRMMNHAIFVGTVSPQRCLVQCGVELQLWNVERLSQRLFEQLTLKQFAGLTVATFPESVAVVPVVEQLLQLEDDLSNDPGQDGTFEADDLKISDTNHELAEQVATCLLDKCDMLSEYFGIGVQCNDEGAIVLISLPVLLPGHAPKPGGLSLFLLRLATEVNWDEEKACFQGVSKELGRYYGCDNDSIQHQVFPAICQLLAPSASDSKESFQALTDLTQLYKKFERG